MLATNIVYIILYILLVVVALGYWLALHLLFKHKPDNHMRDGIENHFVDPLVKRQNSIIGRYYVSPTDLNRMYRLESITPNYITQRDTYNMVDDDCMGLRIQVPQETFNHWILVPENLK